MLIIEQLESMELMLYELSFIREMFIYLVVVLTAYLIWFAIYKLWNTFISM